MTYLAKAFFMTKRTSATWILTITVILCVMNVAIMGKPETTNSAAALQQSPFTLRLHIDLTTGLTSCDMEAGNVFDLAAFAVTPPVTIQQVRFYAQGFQGGSGLVTVRLYTVDSLTSFANAQLVASASPITVVGNTMTAYTVDLGEVLVNSRYVLAALEFTEATVIGVSKGSQMGGRSFTTDCGLHGPVNMNNGIVENDWALGIEMLGYASITVTAEVSPVPTEEMASDATAEATLEPTPLPSTVEVTTEELPTEIVTEWVDTSITTDMPTEDLTVEPTEEG